MIGDTPGHEIDDFDAVVVPSPDEQLLAIARNLQVGGSAGGQGNLVDDLLLRLIDDQDLLLPGADVKQSGLALSKPQGHCAARQKQSRGAHSSLYGNTRSMFRQSLVALAHLLVQSG